MKSCRIAVLMSVFMLFGMGVAEISRAETVVNVLVADVKDASKFFAEMERGRAIYKRLGSPAQIRVLHARYAGPNVGHVVTIVSYPGGMDQLVQDDRRLNGDPEYSAWLAGLDAVRTLRSGSIYFERGSQ